MLPRCLALICLAAPLAALPAAAQTPTQAARQAEASAKSPYKPALPPAQAWIARSNAYTQPLLDISIKYSPESGSYEGLSQYDDQISVPTLARENAQRKEEEAYVNGKLRPALKTETDLNVREDLGILIHQEELGFRQQDFARAHRVPFINATAAIYGSLQSLLDDQVPQARREAAVVRLRKYVGETGGYTPFTDELKTRMQQQMAKPGVLYPSKGEMETQLARNPQIVAGIGALFTKYKLTGWEPAFGTLKTQLAAYDAWLRSDVLPEARTDFRLTPEEYSLALEGYGMSMPPAQLAALAHKDFAEYQAQMATLATEIAKEKGYKSSDYRDVIRELKKDQINGEAILPFYENRLHEIEKIIVAQQLVTLPERPAIIRLGTPAESAQQPAPHMVPPPFLHNTGQRGVFVLPLTAPAGAGQATAAKVDDYTYGAASWTLISHEARPGHELQFDSMVEHGISLARALFSFNSTNAEGWGLYSEYIMQPFEPKEGQLNHAAVPAAAGRARVSRP